jgi:dTDP-4-amino-4,6-dideoxygalactose transaminase
VLSLPMYPELNAVQQEEVVSAVAALQAEALQPA